jgi:hypothetical protein
MMILALVLPGCGCIFGKNSAQPIALPLVKVPSFVTDKGRIFNVKDFGVKADAKRSTEGTIRAESTTLICEVGRFSQADVGKTISINGANIGGRTLITTIKAYISPKQTVLADPAQVSVSHTGVIWGTDNLTALKNVTVRAAGNYIYFPSGNYLLKNIDNGVGVIVPSNTTLYGDGPESVIYTVGNYNSSRRCQDELCDKSTKAWFEVANNSSAVMFENLHFIGELYPYKYIYNNQAAIMLIGSVNVMDIKIRNCTFEYNAGFVAHNTTGAQKVFFTHNTIRYHANGVNLNSDYSDISYNNFYSSEAIEAAGGYSTYSHNIIRKAQSAAGMSIGGRTSPNDVRYGNIVEDNVIEESDGHGIFVGDGNRDSVFRRNTISRTARVGILVTAGVGGAQPSGNKLIENIVRSAGREGARRDFQGIFVSASAPNTSIINNTSVEMGYPGYNQRYGLVVQGDKCVVIGNTVSGTSKDISIDGTTTGNHAKDVVLGDNKVSSTGVQIIRGATIKSP